MSKRKEAEACSSCDYSLVVNPENLFDLFHKSSSEVNPKLKLNKMSVTGRKRKLKAIKVKFLDVQLNGAPFYDFFAKEGEADASVVREAKRRKIRIFSADAPKLSLSIPDAAFGVSQSDVSDCNNKSCADSKTDVDSIPACSSHSAGESTVCSENLSDLEEPIDAVPLRMYYPDAHPVNPSEIEWTVRKILRESDCNAQHRLLIGKKLMETHFLPHLDEETRLQVSTPDGLRIDVLDCNKGIQLKLTLKKWPTANYYGLMDNWRRDFVYRRGLKPGDEVGLCWDQCRKRLLFAVLRRSPVVTLN